MKKRPGKDDLLLHLRHIRYCCYLAHNIDECDKCDEWENRGKGVSCKECFAELRRLVRERK
jgi:hypothetical protein